MQTARQRLFRASSLERLSTPEQLDRLVTITGTGSWLAAATLLVLLSGLLVWGFAGSLAVTAQYDGVLQPSPDDEALVVAVPVPAEQALALREGMAARVSPDAVQPERYGMLRARVSRLSGLPMEAPRPDEAGAGERHEVLVELLSDTDTPSGYRWTSGAGPAVELAAGMPARVEIVLRERRPVDILLPSVATPSSGGGA